MTNFPQRLFRGPTENPLLPVAGIMILVRFRVLRVAAFKFLVLAVCTNCYQMVSQTPVVSDPSCLTTLYSEDSFLVLPSSTPKTGCVVCWSIDHVVCCASFDALYRFHALSPIAMQSAVEAPEGASIPSSSVPDACAPCDDAVSSSNPFFCRILARNTPSDRRCVNVRSDIIVTRKPLPPTIHFPLTLNNPA